MIQFNNNWNAPSLMAAWVAWANTLCLKKGIPTLSSVTSETINGF